MAATNHGFGYVENLPVSDPASIVGRELPVPELRPHDLLVEVAAVSVNPVDVKVRAGADSGGFRVLGFDAAGTVRAVGEAVTRFAPGDEVFYAGAIDRPGTNQRLHAVDERLVGPKPRTLDHADAAALPLTAITAWEALFDRLRLDAASSGTLLVVGAAGGVGSAMVQLARELLPGVRLIATASRRETAAWVRDLGAGDVVDHRGDLAAQVLALAPDGVDWVFTPYSEGQVELYARIVRPFGAVVAIDDGGRDVGPLKSKSIAWHWELMFTRPLHAPDDAGQHELLRRVAQLVDAGRMRTTATTRLTPIAAGTLRDAHERVESGRTIGKIVLSGWDEG